ncbi:hypothetical protein [Sulfurospirillum sp. UCH001]|jgi:hypothetical protein|uniref:hypothetical protein n=1 Tax=Sulfurospirillum sp. UCH001 TaxID=1581011 RepID=UPI0008329AD9|nr:hypothetical protein [Sulfurospirillum sp. UCH001]
MTFASEYVFAIFSGVLGASMPINSTRVPAQRLDATNENEMSRGVNDFTRASNKFYSYNRKKEVLQIRYNLKKKR